MFYRILESYVELFVGEKSRGLKYVTPQSSGLRTL